MFLRDLSVWASDDAKMPRGWCQGDFNLSTQTPVEAYLDLLPRRKVNLSDFAKVNVAIGPRPPDEEPFCDAIDVAVIYWPWFNFSLYFRLSRAEQQQRIVDVLYKALIRIAKRRGSSDIWYHKAYAELMRRQFPLPEISDFELRRRWGLLTEAEIKALKRRSGKGRRRTKRGT